MRVTYDDEADAAYIYLVQAHGKITRTLECGKFEKGDGINLDFDEFGTLVGVEIYLNARKVLPADLMAVAEQIGRR